MTCAGTARIKAAVPLSHEKQISSLWPYLHLQLIQHVEACHAADCHGNFLLKSLAVGWHNCKNTWYCRQPPCSTTFSKVYAERGWLRARFLGSTICTALAALSKSTTKHPPGKTKYNQASSHQTDTKMPNTLKRNTVTGQEPLKNRLALHSIPKIVPSMNDAGHLSDACPII